MFNVWINNGIDKMPEDDILYVIAKGGIFLKKKLGIFESIAPVDKISILDDLDSYAKMYIKSMAGLQFAQILKLFRIILKKYRGEANIILHYHEENGDYKIEVPNQAVSGGSVEYRSLETYPGYLRLGTIHSHPSFSAFHSGVDDADEFTWDGIHMTFGYVNRDNIEISASIIVNGTRFVIDPCDYIDDLELVQYETTPTYASTKYHWCKETREMVKREPKKIYSLGYQVKNIEVDDVTIPDDWIDQVGKYIPAQAYGYVTGGIGSFGQQLYTQQGVPRRYDRWGRKNPLYESTVSTGNKELDRLLKIQAEIDDVSCGYNYSMGVDTDDDYTACEYCPHEDESIKRVFTQIIDGLDDDVVMKIVENLDEEYLKVLGFVETKDDPIDTVDEIAGHEGFDKVGLKKDDDDLTEHTEGTF